MAKKLLDELSTSVIKYSESIAVWMFTYVGKTEWDMEQKKTSITKWISEYLKKHYKKWWYDLDFTFLNKYENIEYEWEVSITNTKSVSAYRTLWNAALVTDFESRQFNKYMWYELIDIKDWKVILQYIDTMWNLKTKKESLTTFANYILENKDTFFKQLYFNYSSVIENVSWWDTIDFKYKLTNNINDKLEVVKLNAKRQSCQAKPQWTTPRHYGRWFYDFFNNGCIVPLIIYYKDKIVWRAACRIFYDEDWNRYLNLERIFGHWHLINHLKEFCAEITKSLLKLNETLTISERFTVTNTFKTNPWYDVLQEQKSTFKLEKINKVLRQPKRIRHDAIEQGYYQDSRIHTICDATWKTSSNYYESKYIYDYISWDDNSTLYKITL